ncbi:Uma2 family endonuclease [Limnoraphis robusta Tam1]|uniref:Uma2 family endonuclease n=1 Tax=Limnoraphis robusta CCNP1315 TaxID=3110306 RepID=A0ABU5U6T8_9CYAN|nr:Uma2 family endonuclease [Limnoraphis robusta]MEA5522926.1 Uma2 family endonuclease [Limnoraphis robusta CCNP1315]MEA5541694.1 Uma2 family endonuclease [Limnoraphis robusta Tam1]MEA5548680.1 Uma2 family endonuclease [Limnoraphis robusta CCNP1324]
MIAQTEKKIYTIEEYLELELTSETRNEYHNGEIIPMTGGTPEHNRISGNLYIALSLSLKRKPYETFHVDQRLWIPAVNSYTYPDVMVVSKPLELQTGRKDTVMNPCFIAEVLSKSTQNYDRSEKFAAYRSIPGFQEYLLIDQSRIHVEYYVKTDVNQWLFTEYDDANITLSLSSFEFQIQIADLYENIDFAEA